jgi:hypothetical protein
MANDLHIPSPIIGGALLNGNFLLEHVTHRALLKKIAQSISNSSIRILPPESFSRPSRNISSLIQAMPEGPHAQTCNASRIGTSNAVHSSLLFSAEALNVVLD